MEISNEDVEYRKNVGLVVMKNGLFFAGFRADVPQFATTGWQLPQGGIDANEDILTAGYRELYEETGITKDKIKFIAQMPSTIKYDFTAEVLQHNKGSRFEKYKGQEQFWLVFEFLGTDNDVDLKATDEPQEFSKFDWKTPEFLITNVYEMKKKAYKEVFAWIEKEKFFIK